MRISDEELTVRLVQEDDVLRQLVDEHRGFEVRLDEIARNRYLSDEEQLEVARIKKLKLKGKDRIHQILATWRREHPEG